MILSVPLVSGGKIFVMFLLLTVAVPTWAPSPPFLIVCHGRVAGRLLGALIISSSLKLNMSSEKNTFLSGTVLCGRMMHALKVCPIMF